VTPAEVWKEIQRQTDDGRIFPQLLKFSGIRLTKMQRDHRGVEFRWLVGPYAQVRAIAQFLRVDAALQIELTQLYVRFGRRDDDRPPSGEHPLKGIGDWGPARTFNLSSVHRITRAKTIARVTDLYDPVSKYWSMRSLESHHIVEKSVLTDLKLNTDDLADDHAPSVLLTAEFHQRFLTPKLASERGFFKEPKNRTASAVCQQLNKIYNDLYPQNSVLSPLRIIAGVIIEVVRDNLFE